jgi:glyoxylase-like metal-dependent hydrolase (beta-lactamase superfamily II)
MNQSNRFVGIGVMVASLLGPVMSAGCGPAATPGSAAASRSTDSGSEIFELVQVTDGVYATVVREGISPSQYAASLIVLRTDHVLVVDSREDAASASDLIETISGLTDLPVRYLVNTHWHGDHVHGNATFRARYPGIRIIGGETADEDTRTLARSRLDAEIERVVDRIDRAKRRLATGQADDGTPLAADDREALPGQIEATEAYLEMRRAIVVVAPEITVEHALELADGSPRVEIIKVGPAHTRGDVVVYIPERGVLALGDLIEDGFPWFGDGYPAGWGTALARISEIDADLYPPAHGPVLRGRDMFDTQRRFVDRVVSEAAGGVAAGRTLEETLAASDFSDFEAHFTRRLSASTAAERADRFAEWLTETLTRAYAEARGELDPGS